MPFELIGHCGSADADERNRVALELTSGIALLRCICGDEPAGTRLEVVWREHELGDYAEICLVWETGSLFDEHSNYVSRCTAALDRLDACIDWRALDQTFKAGAASSPPYRRSVLSDAGTDYVTDTSRSDRERRFVWVFGGFIAGLWAAILLGEPRLWWLPLVLLVPFVAWGAWESWDATRSLMTPEKLGRWLIGGERPKRSRRSRLRSWWSHFTGRATTRKRF